MPDYVQAGRPLQVSTVLGGDTLLVDRITGVEAVSTPFELTVDLLSTSADIDADKLLRTGMSLSIARGDGTTRQLHGLVRRFVQFGRQEDLVEYRAEVVPWLWFLSLSSDCRVFQNMTVTEIVEQVFRDLGFSDYRFSCIQTHPKREYCVQYRETHLAFVSRLLEEEGISYFFEHEKSKHMLVIADNVGAVKPAPGLEKLSLKIAHGSGGKAPPAVLALSAEHAVSSGQVTLADHGIDPQKKLEGTSTGKQKGNLFDFPGRFETREEGGRLARLRLEERESLRHLIRARSDSPLVRSGSRLELTDHYRRDLNQQYHVLRVSHAASQGGIRSGTDATFQYENEFDAVPHAVPYHPPQSTPRPIVHGTQSALVVGPPGEEIFVDKYGRVKVQFFWDRLGKRDDKSSCWVRVASTWAGKQWGFIQIPRIGQEVIVDFMEGDPDRPIVVGRVYNTEQMPPYDLPANGTRSGLKTRSSKGGGTDAFNELRFEDKKDAEEIYLHAQKELNTVVEHDEKHDVQHDRTTTIKNNDTRTIAEGNDKVTVSKGDQLLEITAGGQTVKVKSNRKVTIQQGDDELTVSAGNLTTKVSAGKISSQAMQGIELKVGSNSLVIDSSGITIKGMAVKIEGQVKTEVKGMTVKIEGQVQTDIKGLMTSVKGDGMLMVKGGITMIN
jgi:type VI secretion system secreted protein VgrG